jgi:hypothetical protein
MARCSRISVPARCSALSPGRIAPKRVGAVLRRSGFPLPLRDDRSVLKAFPLRHGVTVVWSRRADTEANVPP